MKDQSAVTFFGVSYQPPSEAQVSAAPAWISRFADRWKRLDVDALRDLMHPDTRNLIPPMKAPADPEGVISHFPAGVGSYT
jgi:hypothetical protein